MHRNLDTSQAPAAADSAPTNLAKTGDQAGSGEAESSEDILASHDPTLKWIVEDPSSEEKSEPPSAVEDMPTVSPSSEELMIVEVAPPQSDPAAGGGDGNLPEIPLEEGSSSEPHEVEMEVLDYADSAEPLTTQLPNEVPDCLRTPTPPPIPAEVALHVRNHAQPEAAATDEHTAPQPKAPSEAPRPVETLGFQAAGWFENQAASFLDGEPVPEALARRPLQKRSKPWYEEVFDEDYLRTLPFMTPEQTAREVRFIREALSPPEGGEVLDIACGYGRHALELAQEGLRVTGLDLSLPMLIRAADHAQKRGLSVNFVHADMREMSFAGQFDAAYCVLSSFGYFDEETNLRVASGICKALKPGGRFLLDIINRDYIVRDLPCRVWWEGDGCVVLEEVDFNYHTSRVLIRRSVAFGNGRQAEQDLSIRAYSLHELGKLLRHAGLRVLDISGGLASKSRFFGSASRHIIAVCERPGS